MSNPIKNGTLAGGQPTIVPIGGNQFPSSAYLTSTAGNREIAISQSGLPNTWKAVTPDVAVSGEISYALLAPYRFVRFTGADDDTWGVL